MQIPRGNQTSDNQINQTAQWKMPENAPENAQAYNRSSYGSVSHQIPGSRGGAYGHPGHESGNRGFNMGKPKKSSAKKRVALGISIFLLVLVALVGADFALNNGKVHYGIKVEGIEIGGLSKAEATTELQTKIDSKLAGNAVQVKPDAATLERLANRAVAGGENSEVPESAEGVLDEGGEVTAGEESTESSGITWSFSAAELGASVDAAVLVEEAYAVGQVNDFFDFFPALAQRFSSWLGQTDLSAEVIFEEETLAASLKTVDDTVSIEMVNSNITIDENGFASVQTGQVGEKVNAQAFQTKAQDVLLGVSGQTIEAPLTSVSLDIDDTEAQAVADAVNATIADPVSFTYEEHTWSAETALLGSWISTSIEGSGESARLIPHVDATRGYDGLQALMGEVGYGSAQNAHIDVSSGTPVIVGGTAGIGPDITTAVTDLDNILFGESGSSRQVTFAKAEVEPAVTAQAVADMGVVELINTYQLGYGSGGGSNREFNIERALDTLNGSLVAPGESWNWNEVVGRCDETTGYLDAGAIDANNEIVQEPGGGICNVATGVFNAAYEAGLPVTERANHSLYMSNYPLGRDAAVSWQYPTLVFKNDTERYILITASYDGTNMFISIWGTNQNRSVESKNSEWADTQDGGRTITNYRTVRNSDGSIWFEDSFYSYFPPRKER